MLVRGVSITPDVLLVAFGLAAVLLGRGRLFLRDWIPFIGLFFAYELMRGYADNIGLADPRHRRRSPSSGCCSSGICPTQVLQDALHPATGPDVLASVATVFYFLHFPLPIAVGFFLWLRRRRVYYDFVAALILLAMAGFATYVLLPVAPPWWAAQHGYLHRTRRPAGDPVPQGAGLRPAGPLLRVRGPLPLQLHDLRHQPEPGGGLPVAPRGLPVPRLPVRPAGVRAGRLAPAGVLGLRLVRRSSTWPTTTSSTSSAGWSTPVVAYWAVIHAPAWFRRVIDQAADDELEAGVEAADAGDAGALARLGRHVRWSGRRPGPRSSRPSGPGSSPTG